MVGLITMIVDSSALLERACDDVIRSAFNSAGQRCSALRLLLVHQEIYEEFVAMLKGAMNDLTIGIPDDLGTDIGPIITFDAVEKLNNYLSKMKTDGHSLFQVSGHTVPSGGSWN